MWTFKGQYKPSLSKALIRSVMCYAFPAGEVSGRHQPLKILAPTKHNSPHHWKFSEGSAIRTRVSTFHVYTIINKTVQATSRSHTKSWEWACSQYLSCHQNTGQNHDIKIANRSFENVAHLKYLATTITIQNLIQLEIKRNLIRAMLASIQHRFFCCLLLCLKA
jgi:hypothetical protein